VSRSTQLPQSRRDRRAAARQERPTPQRHRRKTGGAPVWRSPIALVTVSAIVLGAALVFLALPKPSGHAAELISPPGEYPAALTRVNVIGSATAPVVIQLYADFQCPACRMFVTDQLHRLVDEFVVPGTVRLEAKDVAFLGRGTPDESVELAAGAACATAQGRYWQFHDLAFWNQGRENQGDHDAAFIGRIADAAGVDRAEWDACVTRSDVRPAIASRTAAAATQGINRTPTLVVNGQAVVGVPSYDQLAGLIRSMATVAPAPIPSTTH
jgi:protein-disulfide isomerase